MTVCYAGKLSDIGNCGHNSDCEASALFSGLVLAAQPGLDMVLHDCDADGLAAGVLLTGLARILLSIHQPGGIMHLDLTPAEHDDGACRSTIHSGDKYAGGVLWLCKMFLF